MLLLDQEHPPAGVREGHVPEWDPPLGLEEYLRWTCWACGGSVIATGPDADCVSGALLHASCAELKRERGRD